MKLLICIDGSSNDLQSVQLVSQFNFPSRSQITLLGVLENPIQSPLLQGSIDKIINIFGSNYAVDVKIRAGDPIEEITLEVMESPYDLVVVGSGAQEGLLQPKVGSTTKKLTRKLHTHFLVARNVPENLGRIIFCIGMETPESETLTFGGVSLCNTVATINLLHVVSDKDSDIDDGQKDKILAIAKKDLENAGVHNPINTKIRRGLVVEEVLNEVSNIRCQLLVVGAHFQPGKDRWQGALLDDVTDQLLNRCPCSMLII